MKRMYVVTIVYENGTNETFVCAKSTVKEIIEMDMFDEKQIEEVHYKLINVNVKEDEISNEL